MSTPWGPVDDLHGTTRALRHQAERLTEVVPACTYLGLAPFMGAERALPAPIARWL